jgi:molybdopterin-binding protein
LKISRSEKNDKVREIAGELGIRELLHRKPGTLSGGELQRVALGRTLIQHPAILLLDEPLASLDSRLKSDLRRLLRSIHRKGQTILHVTHDYEEALSLATKIAVIQQGTIIQTGTPAEVFNHPKSSFVAHFIGVKNFLPVTLTRKNNITLALTGNKTAIHLVTDMAVGDGFIMIRGEDITLSLLPVETSASNNFEGIIVDIVQKSEGIEVCVDVGFEIHALVTRESLENLNLAPGRTCWIHFKATAVRYILNR